MEHMDFDKIGEHFEKTLRPPAHYRKKRSLRITIVLAACDALVTGFFLGAAHTKYLQGRGSWIWPLMMAFPIGAGMLWQIVLALRDCPRLPKTPENEGDAAHRQGLPV